MDDLVETDGLYYQKSTDVPFTGKVTGKYQGTFKDGKLDGPWVRYHDNGQLWDKGDYKNGKREGTWVYYNRDGSKNTDNSGIYRNGKKVSDQMKRNIIIGLLILVPIIVVPVMYFQHDRIETLFSPEEPETVNWSELNKTGGLYYKKFTDIPFTGIAEGKEESSDDGTTRSPIRDGLKNGVEKDSLVLMFIPS